MKITKDNLIDYLFDNTGMDYPVEVNELKDEFRVVANCGGDYVNYVVKKADGSIYVK